MRRIAAVLVALALAGLCGCGEGGAEGTSSASTTTITASVPNAASVDFMSETYTAPESYEGVPEEYWPVLDAVYLHAQVDRLYHHLNRQSKMTEDISKEHAAVIMNLYKPYLIGSDYYSDELTCRGEYE